MKIKLQLKNKPPILCGRFKVKCKKWWRFRKSTQQGEKIYWRQRDAISSELMYENHIEEKLESKVLKHHSWYKYGNYKS